MLAVATGNNNPYVLYLCKTSKQSTSYQYHCQWVITLWYLHLAQEKHFRISTILPKVGRFGTLLPQACRSFPRLLKDIAFLHHFPAKLFGSATLLHATSPISPQWRFVVIFPRLATELSPKRLSTQLLQSLLDNFSTTLSSTILSYSLYQPLHSRHPIPGTLLQHLDFWQHFLPRQRPTTGLNHIEYWTKPVSAPLPLFSKCSSPHHQLPLILYTTDLPSLHNLHNFHVFVYITHLVCSIHLYRITWDFYHFLTIFSRFCTRS